MSTNVFEQARDYIAASGDENIAYRRDLLKRINGNGYTLTQRQGKWYLMSNLDNRKKWPVG